MKIIVEIFEEQFFIVEVTGKYYGFFMKENLSVIFLWVEVIARLVADILFRLEKENIFSGDAFVSDELLVVEVDGRQGPVVLHVSAELAPAPLQLLLHRQVAADPLKYDVEVDFVLLKVLVNPHVGLDEEENHLLKAQAVLVEEHHFLEVQLSVVKLFHLGLEQPLNAGPEVVERCPVEDI